MRPISMRSTPTFTSVQEERGRSAIESTTASGCGSASRSAPGRNLPVRTSTPRSPIALAPPMSASTSSPTITASAGVASTSASAASKYAGVGLAHDLRLDARGVLEPGDERAGVEERPAARLPPAVPVQADEPRALAELGEGPVQVVVGEDFARSRRSRRRRREGRPRRRRRRARRTRRGRLGSSSSSARARACPARACPAASGVVVDVLALELESDAAELVGEPTPRARVVLFVTKRSRWPSSRSARTASGAPGIGLPRDVQDTVDVQENRRHPHRVYSGARRGSRSPSSEIELALLALERPRRAARPEDRDPRRGGLRRRRLGDPVPRRRKRRLAPEGRACRPRGRPGRAQPVRATASSRSSASPRRSGRACSVERKRRPTTADGRGPGAPPREEEAPRNDEEAPSASDRRRPRRALPGRSSRPSSRYSTVTVLARLRGWSMFRPRRRAIR